MARIGSRTSGSGGGSGGSSSVDLTERFNDTTETIPVSMSTVCAVAGVTKTLPALVTTAAGAVPQVTEVVNTSAGTINVTYPNIYGSTVTTTMLAGEVLTLRQRTSLGWGAKSGNKTLSSLAGQFSAGTSSKQAQQIRTLVDQSTQLAAVTPAAFEDAGHLGVNPVIVQPGEQLEEFYGVGAALTESSASLLLSMTDANRTALLREMFDPAQNGWSCVRISLGTSDFRVASGYSYDENGGTFGIGGTGAADTTLAAYSANKDQQYVIPVLQQIMAINPRVRVFASVWTQPSWMLIACTPPTTPAATPSGTGGTLAAGTYYYKITALLANGAESTGSTEVTATTTGATSSVALTWVAVTGATGYRVYRGTATGAESVYYASAGTSFTDTGAAGTAGTVPSSSGPAGFNDTYMTAYANYIVKSVQAYQAAGIPIFSVAPQDEPTGNFTRWTATEMSTFIGTYLGPAFDTAGLTAKIMAGDDNWNQSAFVTSVLTDATAGPYVDGVGWHGYGGNALVQTAVSRAYPRAKHYFTEVRSLIADAQTTTVDTMVGGILINSIRNGARAVMLWNIALNETGGPVSTSSTGRQGVVTINATTKAVTRNAEFAALSHVSRYLKPGARRVNSTTYSVGRLGTDVQSVAFVNPDGQVVLVVYNPAANARRFRVADARTGQSFPVSLASQEVATFVWGTSATDSPAGAVSARPSIAGVTSQSGASVASLTFAHAVPAGLPSSALVVAVALSASGSSSPALSGVTYAGQALTKITSVLAVASAGTNRATELWYLLSPPAGGGNVVCTSASGTVTMSASALTFTKVSQTAPFGTPQTAGASTTTLSATVTDAVGSDVVLSMVSVRANLSPVPTPAQAAAVQVQVGTNLWALGTVQPATGSAITVTDTWITSDYGALAAVAVHAA